MRCVIAMQQEYWRNNMHQSQRKVNDLAGENRRSWCNRMYASSGYLVEHRKRVGKRVGKRACAMKPKNRSYKGTQVDQMVQNKKRAELLKMPTSASWKELI